MSQDLLNAANAAAIKDRRMNPTMAAADIDSYNSKMSAYGADAKKANFTTGQQIVKTNRIVEILEMMPGNDANDKGEYRVEDTTYSYDKGGNKIISSQDYLTPASNIDDWAMRAAGGSIRKNKRKTRRSRKRKSRRRTNRKR